jgi:hypothetical protein
VNVIVPPVTPVIVTLTGSPAVAPEPVTIKPDIKAVLPAGQVNVAVATAAATLPEDANRPVASEGMSEFIDCTQVPIIFSLCF